MHKEIVVVPAVARPPHSLIKLLQPGERVRGRYRLMGMVRGQGRAGEFWRIQLADRTGKLTSFGWPGQLNCGESIVHGEIVETEFVTRQFHQLVGDVRALDWVADRDPLEAIDLLPAPLCPQPQLLERLADVVGTLSMRPLLQFTGTLLGRDDLAFRLMSAPASIRHHHNFPGGLLAHSVEVAEIVAGLPCLSTKDRELAIVAALFHDIGKIWTLDHQMRLTELGNLVTHDDLTLELCAQPLATLDQQWRDAALMLRHVWSCASAGARYGVPAQSALADAVRLADRLSAQCSSEALAFAAAPGGFKYAHDTVGRRWRALKPKGG